MVRSFRNSPEQYSKLYEDNQHGQLFVPNQDIARAEIGYYFATVHVNLDQKFVGNTLGLYTTNSLEYCAITLFSEA